MYEQWSILLDSIWGGNPKRTPAHLARTRMQGALDGESGHQGYFQNIRLERAAWTSTLPYPSAGFWKHVSNTSCDELSTLRQVYSPVCLL
jgi:hypothetical protein